MLENFVPKGYNHFAQVAPFTQTTAISVPPVVHATPVSNNEIHHIAPPTMNAMPVINDEIYHAPPSPSESLGFYGQMDEFQDQFNEMQKEVKAL